VSLFFDIAKTIFTARYSEKEESRFGHVNSVNYYVTSIEDSLEVEDIATAGKIIIEALCHYPDSVDLLEMERNVNHLNYLKIVSKRFPGHPYLTWLQWFHKTLRPRTYLEIGVESGQSLQFACAPTRAVGVDPEIRIVHGQENWVKLFKLTSDHFFSSMNIEKVFDASSIDFAFIDGLHTYDQALKDFINIEKYSNKRTVVLFHDIFPIIPLTAERDRKTTFWVGDTWKVMLILLKVRPDLGIFTIPTFPSGLGVITNLNRSSTILSDDFDSLCDEANKLDLKTFPNGIGDNINTIKNEYEAVASLLVDILMPSQQK